MRFCTKFYPYLCVSHSFEQYLIRLYYRYQVIYPYSIFLASHSAARISFFHLSSTKFFYFQFHFSALLFHAHSSMICISANFSSLSFSILFTCSNIFFFFFSFSLYSVCLFSQYFITITSKQTQFIPLNRLQEFGSTLARGTHFNRVTSLVYLLCHFRRFITSKAI